MGEGVTAGAGASEGWRDDGGPTSRQGTTGPGDRGGDKWTARSEGAGGGGGGGGRGGATGASRSESGSATSPRPLSPSHPLRAGEHAPSLDALKEDVVFEGWLQKKSNKGLSGLKPWQRRYFVLYRSANELRYYKNMVRAVAHCCLLLAPPASVPPSHDSHAPSCE